MLLDLAKINELVKIEESEDLEFTLNENVVIEGRSPYTQDLCKIIIHPAESNGIVFRINEQIVPASSNFIKDDDSVHTTSLKKDDIEIRTVEHLLSGLWGLGIDHAEIEMFSKYLPFPDASAESYVESLLKVGVKELSSKRKYLTVSEQFSVEESEDDDRRVTFIPNDKFVIESTTSFDNIVNTHTVFFDWSPSNYKDEIAWARTFLRSKIDPDGNLWTTVRKVFPYLPDNPKESPIIIYDDHEFLIPLRKEDEPARHKVLDFIGDMSLLGIRLRAKVISYKPGHKFNRKIVQAFSDAL